jgi:hypothetical protein
MEIIKKLKEGNKPSLFFNQEKNMIFGLGLVCLQLLFKEKEIEGWNMK